MPAICARLCATATGLLILMLAFSPAALRPDQPGAQATGAKTAVIALRHKFFDPAVVVIHEGDTVVWANETGGGWHDVISYEGAFSSPQLSPGEAFRHTFTEAGVYGFYCTPHHIDGMIGTVIVLPRGTPLPDALPEIELSPSSADLHLPPPSSSPDTIQTIAGGGGSGGSATDASLYLPEGIAVASDGVLFIADTENCQVRRVETSGEIVSVLGHESCGSSMGSDADLGPWLHTNHPRAVAAGPDGALYVSDTLNCRVRRLDASGKVSTFAGSGSCRASGDGRNARRGGLSPWGIALNGEGNLYVADVFNCRVRKITTRGVISTVAGTGICGFSGDGGPATNAQLFFPRDVAVAADGTLYVADTSNCRVRRITARTALIETVAGDGSCEAGSGGLEPWALAVADDGPLLIADRANCRVVTVSAAGGLSALAGDGKCAFSGEGDGAHAAELNAPSDIAATPDGSVLIADTGNCRVRRIDANGRIETLAGNGACLPGGDGGPATSGGAWHPMGIATGPGGDWYFSELDTCRVRHIDTEGAVTTVAGNGRCGFSGDGGPAREARLGDQIAGLALAADGALFIADGFNCRVRRVSPDGWIDTVAGSTGCGFAGDGGPATEARLELVSDVALDGSGRLLIADPFNCRVRRVDLQSGAIDTAAGNGSCEYNGDAVPASSAGIEPWAVAVGPDNAIYIADTNNCRVREIDELGRIVTVAGSSECGTAGDGGAATKAQLFRPFDVVLDTEGNLYIADLRAFVVRRVDTAGVISTVAGAGVSRPIDIGGFDPTGGLLCSLHGLPVPAPTYLGDDGAADRAGLYFPYAIALGHDGHLYIADTFDHRVRRVGCGGDVPCAGPAPQLPGPGADADESEDAWWKLPAMAGAGVAVLLLMGAAGLGVRALSRRRRSGA